MNSNFVNHVLNFSISSSRIVTDKMMSIFLIVCPILIYDVLINPSFEKKKDMKKVLPKSLCFSISYGTVTG